jgi:hypothetical protein
MPDTPRDPFERMIVAAAPGVPVPRADGASADGWPVEVVWD